MARKKQLEQEKRAKLLRTLSQIDPLREESIARWFKVIKKNHEVTLSLNEFTDIVMDLRTPDAIADRLLEKVEVPRLERSDAAAGYKRRQSDKYKGRPPGEVYRLMRRAMEIIANRTLPEWEKEFGIDRVRYETLKAVCLNILADEPIGHLKTDFSEAAMNKMWEELNTLWQVLQLFRAEIEEAKQKKNTLFLNTAREILKEYAPSYLESISGRGRKVGHPAMKKRFLRARQYVWSKGGVDVPSTFYDRDRPTLLCFLAYVIHSIFFGHHQRELKRKKAEIKILLLMEKYDIPLTELFSNADVDDKSSPTVYRSLIGIDKPVEQKPQSFPEADVDDWLKRYMERKKWIDEKLEELKDI